MCAPVCVCACVGACVFCVARHLSVWAVVCWFQSFFSTCRNTFCSLPSHSSEISVLPPQSSVCTEAQLCYFPVSVFVCMCMCMCMCVCVCVCTAL